MNSGVSFRRLIHAIHVFFVLFSIIANHYYLAAQITFQKVYGGQGGSDYIKSVKQTTDGGYIYGGYTNSAGEGGQDICLVKTNDRGDLVWSKTYGGLDSENSYSVIQCSDGGYVITGFTLSYGQGVADVYLLKTNDNGSLLWHKTFGGSLIDYAYDVIEMYDGSFVITGVTKSFGEGGSDVYLIKTNENGILLWSKTFGGLADDEGFSVIQTADGGHFICGYTESFGAGAKDVYRIKTDSIGTMLWNKSFGGFETDIGYKGIETVDGSFVISGRTDSYGAGGSDIYLLKVDAFGSLLWSKTFGGTNVEVSYDMILSSDGGFVITGTIGSYGFGTLSSYLLKTDANGIWLWSKAYGSGAGLSVSYNYSVIQTNDGGFLAAGATHCWDANPVNGFGDEFYVIKTDNLGVSGCHEISFNPSFGVGASVSSGGLEGSGGIEGNGCVENSWTPDTLTLCIFEPICVPINANWSMINDACNSQCEGEIAISPIAGTGPFTYSWSGGIAGPNDSIAFGVCAGSYSVIISASDGCDATYNFQITNPNAPSVTISQTQQIFCYGDSSAEAQATPTGGTGSYGYTWNTNPPQNTQSATGLPPGTYVVTIIDSLNCQMTDTITITEPLALTSSLNSTNATCDTDNGTAIASANGGTGNITYQWDDPQNQTTPQIIGLSDATYTVTITDDNGCQRVETATILMASNNPFILAWPDTAINQGSSVQINSSGGDTCTWSPTTSLSDAGNCDPIASPTQTTTYIVEVIENGCKGLDTITITVEKLNFTLYIPNAFTPNGDNANAMFEIKGEGIDVFNLKIYDRWGELIFQSNDINTLWNGTVNGRSVPEDVFVYHLMINDVRQEKYSYVGKLSLIR